MTYETGDKTYEPRVERFNRMKEMHKAGKAFREIGEAFPNEDGSPLSRQAVHKILQRGEVKPAGRPRGTVILPKFKAETNGTPRRKTRATIEASIEKWHARLVEATRRGNSGAFATATAKLSDLHAELLAATR